jgi:hypothetical protein
MQKKNYSIIFLIIGSAILITAGLLFFTPAHPVNAQCGSQASSCKNCHETQGQDPVNKDGTTWHTQHAFGDFCYLCHAGNNQATDITAAHTGMVAPLSDIVTNCKNCHPKDFEPKAQEYAAVLGVTVGTGATTGTGSATQEPIAPSESSSSSNCNQVGLPSDVVDYNQRYDELALGKKPVNVGNTIFMVILGAIVLGGGFLILRREGLVAISFEEFKKGKKAYPAEVTGMLPGIAKLKPDARKVLKRLLEKPQTAARILSSAEKQLPKDNKEK